jgi:hypothetical protein
MQAFINIGPVPRSEVSAQVGQPEYAREALRECHAYRKQLIHQFGPPPGSARFTVRSFKHNFGTILGVCVVFDDARDEEVEFAHHVEAAKPDFWDSESLRDLARTRSGSLMPR